MKQTAVEYLIEHLKEMYHLTEETLYEFEEAKAMEKEQIESAAGYTQRQQERMYSEEDMKQFAEWLIKVNFNYTSNISDVFLIWNKQFKKK